MAHIIHARNRDGGIRFRIWSTICDAYLSDPLTEEELRAKLRQAAIEQAIEEFERTIDARIEHAKRNGTSSLILFGEPTDLNGPWEKQRGVNIKVKTKQPSKD